MDRSFISFLAVVVSIGLAITVPVIAIMVARKLTRATQDVIAPTDLEEIYARLEEVDALKERLIEVEDRLDFAERLLEQQREQGRLPEPEHLTPV